MRAAILHAFYEYLLVTSPVGLYVLMEAVESDCLELLAFSPEWSIATIFLSFQAVSLYRKDLARTRRKLFAPWLDILGLIALIIAVLASVNAYFSLHHNTMPAILFRLVLFAVVSVAFMVFVGAGKLALLRLKAEESDV